MRTWCNWRSISIVYNDIQEVCGGSRLATALVVTFAGFNHSTDFLPDAKHQCKSAFADILRGYMVTYVIAR